MAKYSFEFKKKVVLEYIAGGGVDYLSKKYCLGSNTQLRKWIKYLINFGKV